MSNQTPAGWYPDPYEPGKRRFWNGAAWTEHVDPPAAPAATAPPPPPASAPTVPIPAYTSMTPGWSPTGAVVTQEWWKRPWVLATGGFAAVVILAAAISSGGSGDDTKEADAPVQPTVTVTADASEAASASASPPSTAPSPSASAPSAEPTPPAAAETTAAQAPKPVKGTARNSWVMPDEVGKDLQAAQDHIQGVTDNPFFFTDSADATGASRFQILDVDWTVCDQKPAAGVQFGNNTNIVFYVVKDSEDCP